MNQKFGTLQEALFALIGKPAFTDMIETKKECYCRMKYYTNFTIDTALKVKELLERPGHGEYLLKLDWSYEQSKGSVKNQCTVFKFLVNPNVIPYKS